MYSWLALAVIAACSFQKVYSSSSSGSLLRIYGNADSNDFSCSALGATVTNNASATCSSGTTDCYMCSPGETVAGLGSNIVDSCTGGAHSLAVDSNGQVYGTGAYALLGLGSSESNEVTESCYPDGFRTISMPASIAGQVSNVTCGANYSVAWNQGTGAMAFWGFNRKGVSGVASEATQSFYSSPSIIDILTSTGITSSDGVTVKSVQAAGTDSLLLFLSNGSLITTGAGAVRSIHSDSTDGAPTLMLTDTSDSSAASSAVYLLGGCTLVSVSAGSAHVLGLCTNGSVLGWGSNLQKQIEDSSTFTITHPTDTGFSIALTSLSQAQLAAGSTNSMLLDVAGNKLYARGSNQLGESGLGSSVTQAAVWAQVTSPLPTSTMTSLSAGAGYSLITTSASILSTNGGHSNVFVSGSNIQCALGIGVLPATTLQVFTFMTVPFSDTSLETAIKVVASESRRTMILSHTSGTVSKSINTNTASHTTVRTHSSSMTVTPAATASKAPTSSKSDSLSLSKTLSLSPVPTTTINGRASESVAPTITEVITRSSTPSVSLPARPQLLLAQVYYIPTFFILVSFSWPTDYGGLQNSMNEDLHPANIVDRLFVISGSLQTFGGNYTGYWVNSTQYVIDLTNSTTANVTAGVGVIGLSPYANIKNADGTSLNVDSGFTLQIVAATETSAPETPSPPIEAESGGSRWWVILLIVLACVLLLVLICALFIWFLRSNTKKAQQEERVRRNKEEEEYKKHVKVVAQHEEHYLEETAPIEDTVMFSSHYGDSPARDLSPMMVETDDGRRGNADWSQKRQWRSGMMMDIGISPKRKTDPIGKYYDNTNSSRAAIRMGFAQNVAEPIYVPPEYRDSPLYRQKDIARQRQVSSVVVEDAEMIPITAEDVVPTLAAEPATPSGSMVPLSEPPSHHDPYDTTTPNSSSGGRQYNNNDSRAPSSSMITVERQPPNNTASPLSTMGNPLSNLLGTYSERRRRRGEEEAARRRARLDLLGDLEESSTYRRQKEEEESRKEAENKEAETGTHLPPPPPTVNDTTEVPHHKPPVKNPPHHRPGESEQAEEVAHPETSDTKQHGGGGAGSPPQRPSEQEQHHAPHHHAPMAHPPDHAPRPSASDDEARKRNDDEVAKGRGQEESSPSSGAPSHHFHPPTKQEQRGAVHHPAPHLEHKPHSPPTHRQQPNRANNDGSQVARPPLRKPSPSRGDDPATTEQQQEPALGRGGRVASPTKRPPPKMAGRPPTKRPNSHRDQEVI